MNAHTWWGGDPALEPLESREIPPKGRGGKRLLLRTHLLPVQLPAGAGFLTWGCVSPVSGHLPAVPGNGFFSHALSFPHSSQAEAAVQQQDRSESWKESMQVFGNAERPGAEVLS